MSAQPTPEPRPAPSITYQPSRNDEFSFKRRRNHSHIEAMTSRILQAIGYPTKRHRDFICALQAVHGGGEDARIPYKPFKRSHLTLAKLMQVSGSDENKRKFVYRELCSLRSFTETTGIMLFHVTPGSEEESTEYIDYLTPTADEAMQRALSSSLWKTNKRTAIDEAVAWAVEQLPRVEVKSPPERDNEVQRLDDYMATQTDQLLAALEKRFDGIEARHGNAEDEIALLDRLYALSLRAIESRRKTAPARHDYASLSIFNEAEISVEAASGKVGDGTNLSAPSAEKTNENATAAQLFASKLDAARAYARVPEPAWRIVPLHTPDIEGRCSCHKPNCQTPGKHPRITKWQKHGTNDPAQLEKWWGMWPDANVGVVCGCESGIVVLDVDPRHGGDVSISALIEQYGEWPRTLEADTGGGGKHIIFEHPSVTFKNSASMLGEGLDIKTDNGLIVVAPSNHVSGKVYRWSQLTKPAPMPEWMIAELTKERPRRHATEQSNSPIVITSDGPPILDGCRNSKLFEIACALRGKGATCEQLQQAMYEINKVRCKDKLGHAPFPLETEEVERIVASALRYEPNTLGGCE